MIHRVLLSVVLITFCAGSAGAGTFTVFGPERFERGTGDPVSITRLFDILNPGIEYALRLQNGGLVDGESEKALNVSILLNGTRLLGPASFSGVVELVERPVVLEASNVLTVELRAKPGGSAYVSLLGFDEDLPIITASVSPQPNADGWNNSEVTVSFICSDATSGIASCSAPVVLSDEGAGQDVCGTAIDLAGNRADICVPVNIDTTPPVLSIDEPAPGAATSLAEITVAGTASDANGIALVACNGVGVPFAGDSFSCDVPLAEGVNLITVSATDPAENSTTDSLDVRRIMPGECRDLFFSGDLFATEECLTALLLGEPGNQEAHLMQAIARILDIFEESGSGANQSALAASIEDMESTLTLKEILAQFGMNVDDFGLHNMNIDLPDPLPPDSPTSGDVQDFLRSALLPRLNAATEENLEQIDASFSAVISAEELEHLGFPGLRPVEIDYGDVKMLEAALRLLEGFFVFGTAYDFNIDLDEFLSIDTAWLIEIFDPKRDILEPYPDFLKLLPEGHDLLPRLGETLGAGIDAYLEASNYIRNVDDFDQNDDVITIDPFDYGEELKLRTRLGLHRCLLDGATFVGLTETAAICDPVLLPLVQGEPTDLPNFFDSALDLRDALPELSVVEDCESGFIDVSSPGPNFPFPNPTLNGVLPEMTQERMILGLGLQPDIDVFVFLAPYFSVTPAYAIVENRSGELARPLVIQDVRLEDGIAFEISVSLPRKGLFLCERGDFLEIPIRYVGFVLGCFSDALIVESNDPNEPVIRAPFTACR